MVQGDLSPDMSCKRL